MKVDKTGQGAESPLAPQSAETSSPHAALHTVGIGASAGGLEALEQFFEAMPADSGCAFVVVTHQPADHVSLLPELLSRHSKMEVELACDGMQVLPNHIYIRPPGKNLTMVKGCLKTTDHHIEVHLPIDHFFRSLASDQQERAVCVVLSGTGTDGTLGLREIKGASGMAMAQDEGSAQYSGMPLSAVATGLVDYVLPPGRMPEQLLQYVRANHEEDVPGVMHEQLPRALEKIFVLLRNGTGHDFSGYKVETLRRRIERRIRVHLLEQPLEYVQFLETHPHELDLLFQELLIGVTSFFRDPEAFEALERALELLVRDRSEDMPLRIWVPGCSTGEEAYSIGILAAEIAARSSKGLGVQIFASDLDAESVEFARAGAYAEGIVADLGPARLERFFTRKGNRYHIKKEIREGVVFAVHNIIRDPPFTKLDLISCRNLLIYLKPEVQKRLIPMFHYALCPGGLLLLGTSESTGGFDRLFGEVDRKCRLYERQPVTSNTVRLALPISRPPKTSMPAAASVEPVALGVPDSVAKLLLARFAPPTVIANERGEIAYTHGQTGPYLELNVGEPRTNLFVMARGDLRYALPSAVRAAALNEGEALRKDVKLVSSTGEPQRVNLSVQRILDPEPIRGLFRVTFEPTSVPQPDVTHDSKRRSRHPSKEADLEEELERSRVTLQESIEEFETSNQELKSANEELQSMNEELQSSNEELETSREELQSLNEELQTVNAEYQTKLEQLARAKDDMHNLLNSTDIATLFLDRELKIQSFTEQTRDVIRVIPSDIGRPVADFASRLRYHRLAEDARQVLATLVPHEVEVQTIEDKWRLLRMLPYRTSENVIDGVVVTFVDIDRVKRAELLATSREFAEGIVQTVREPLAVLDGHLRIVSANRAFLELFGLSGESPFEPCSLFDVGGDFFAHPRLRALLDEVVESGSAFQDFLMEHTIGHTKRSILLNARRLEGEAVASGHILLALGDVTAR